MTNSLLTAAWYLPVPCSNPFGISNRLARIAGNTCAEEYLEPGVAVDGGVALLEMEDDGPRERKGDGDLVVAHHLDGVE